MLAALLLGLAPLVLMIVAVAFIRRALPILLAASSAWVSFSVSGQIWDASWVGLGVLTISVVALDAMAKAERTRSTTITLEWLAGVTCAALVAFAVCYSAGLRDGWLVLAVILAAVVATYATLSLRTKDAAELE